MKLKTCALAVVAGTFLFVEAATAAPVGAWPAVQTYGVDSTWHTSTRTTWMCHIGMDIIPAADLGPKGCQQVYDAAAKAKRAARKEDAKKSQEYHAV